MALTDLFRPKYRHSDAQVRARAVRDLGVDEAELLIKIAGQDDDPAVRTLALSKIEDAEALVELVAREKDPGVKRAAEARAAELWSKVALAEDATEAKEAITRLALLDDQSKLADVVMRSANDELRRSALERITDNKALGEIVRGAGDSALRKRALEGISDIEILRSIAIDESRKPVGLAAVDRITDLDVLEAVAAKAKNKHVRQRAQKHIAEQKKDHAPKVSDEDKRAHAERVQLVREVKKLAHSDEWTESLKRLEEARDRWAALGAGNDEELERSFNKYVERSEERYEKIGRRALELAEAERLAAAAAAREAEERSAVAEEPAEAATEVETPREEPEPQASVADSEADKAARYASDKEKEEAREQRQRVGIARLEALCIELEELASSDRYREIDRRLTAAAKSFAGLKLRASDDKTALVERYEEARRTALIHAKSLREADEWKRWAALPKLQALIDEAKALMESDDLARLGRQLKALQQAWKEVGPGPHDKNQEMWETFKESCDRLYERVREHRKIAAAEYAENYDRKVALCEAVEALAESTDWEETAAKIKSLQSEWKSIGPVPRKKSKKIWERFRSACDVFFDRRKPVLEERMEELTGNLTAKEALCAEIEALASSDAEWDDVVSSLEDLRGKWRRLGHVPRKDYEALNQRYREACAAVFSRREEAEKARKEQMRAEVEGLIGRLDQAMKQAGVDAGWDDEDVAVAGDENDMVRIAGELRAAARELEAEEAELSERARAMIRAAVEASPEAFDGSELDPSASRARAISLIERLEALVPAEQESADIEELTSEQVAEKLREALAANALGIVKQHERPVSELVSEITASWKLIGPILGREGIDLHERFERVRTRVLESYARD